MSLTAPLRNDHQALRSRLGLLKGAMRVAPEAQFALRELCWSLARLLEAHIEREGQVLASYSNETQALARARITHDCADQHIVLRDVNALLLNGLRTPLGTVVPRLAHLVEELEECVEEEEREVFPMVDRIAEEEALDPRSLQGSHIIEV